MKQIHLHARFPTLKVLPQSAAWLPVLLAIVLWHPCSATATTRTVTNLNDSGAGTLRDTIAASAANDTIIFTTNGTITLTSGELLLGRSLTIAGPGAMNLTISGNNTYRVFEVASNVTVTISGLTITAGSNTSSTGGGGVFNQGTLTINNCGILGNVSGPGGGICNAATVTINNCTIAGNISYSQGGGIWNGAFGTGGPTSTAIVNNSTVIGNTVSAGLGGGIYNLTGANLTVNNSTITENTVPEVVISDGGGIFGLGNQTLINTIVAGNSARYSPDINGQISSLGHNLIGITGESSGWVGSDLTGTISSPLDAQLGRFQYNGGPTPTITLLATSPAIDAGDDAVLTAPYNITTDQRGVHRPNGAHVDIGAYEAGSTILVTTLADSGLGSLRSAIVSAADGDRVLFAPLVTGTIVLTSGELLIGKSLNILGPGATNLTVSGNQSSRVFHVSPTGNLNLFGLTLANGSVTGAAGASDAAGGNGFGGGLLNEGSASLIDGIISYSTALGGVGGTGLNAQGSTANGGNGGNGAGGGIYNDGLLSLLRCTLTGNFAKGGLGGTGGHVGISPAGSGGTGGAAFGAGLASAGITTLTNCTLAGNNATAGQGGTGGSSPTYNSGGTGGLGGTAHGAGFSADSGSPTLTSCTISSNFSVVGSGGYGGNEGGFGGDTFGPGSANSGGLFSAGNVQLQNTLIAGNQADASPDVDGTVQSGGFNLVGISDGSAGWVLGEAPNLGDSNSPIDARLGPLQNYGGLTPTMALRVGSPAIDQGYSFGLTTDQRGEVRNDYASIDNSSGGDGSDIGAYETAALRITAITKQGNNMQLSFASILGASYSLRGRTNLASGSWTSIPGSYTGNGTITQATLTNGFGAPTQFYSVHSP